MKDLLLHLDGTPRDEERLGLVLDLARAHDAALTGLFVGRHIADGLLLDAPPSGVLIETLEREREARRASVASRFDELTANEKIHCNLVMEDGDPVRWLGLHGRYADLIVVGQAGEEVDLLGTGGVPGAVALTSGRPVLMIPRAGTGSLVPDRIVVGWNESQEATRAIDDALPFLKRASRVEVLTIGADLDAETGPSSAQRMTHHLSRHAVAAEAHHLPQPETDAAEAFLAEANRYGANMVVMGAYGRSRLREFVLGGMTRYLLNYSSLPLLLSH